MQGRLNGRLNGRLTPSRCGTIRMRTPSFSGRLKIRVSSGTRAALNLALPHRPI